MRDILYLTDATTYEGYLTGPNNFRKEIFPEYKANRKDKPKPVHLPAIRDFLVREWNAKITDGCEADDMLGVAQVRHNGNSVICSIDKDLLQIPGKHFNFVKAEWYDVSLTQGIRHFYEQLLKGDKTDGIPGVAGLGEKKAARLLEGCETEQELFDVCREQYKNDELLLTYGTCLWISREENKTWLHQILNSDLRVNFPNLTQMDAGNGEHIDFVQAMELFGLNQRCAEHIE